MNLPQSDILTTKQLGRAFRNTTATYKFFWLISILQLMSTGTLRLSVWDIVVRMVALAWYPVHFFHLSFGKSDSLFNIVTELQQLTDIPTDASVDSVYSRLCARRNEPAIKQRIAILTTNVPYRFLMPWIHEANDRTMMLRSQTLENSCLYALYRDGDNFDIEINPAWQDYLTNNFTIVTDFAYWNLTLFLQQRNPNVPNIAGKLIKPSTRNSLTKQRRYWDTVIDHGCEINCIYTGMALEKAQYDLDHFVPWSFVSHDLLWNLVPANSSINSSKSNKLPNLDDLLPKFANVQQQAIQTVVRHNLRLSAADDFATLGYSVKDLSEMDSERFLDLYSNTYRPLSQIAQNMGFEIWNNG